MAVSMERRSQTLSRFAATTSPPPESDTPPKTLEDWILTSGITESLSSSSPHVEVCFKGGDHEIPEGNHSVTPRCCIQVVISVQEADSINIFYQYWDIVSMDYTETEIWQAVSSNIQKLQLSCLPEFLLGRLSSLQHLELHAKPKPTCQDVDDDVSDFSASGEQTIVTAQQQSLFTRDEMAVLIDLLLSPLCQLESLHCTWCDFGDDVMTRFVHAIAANQTLQRATLRGCNFTVPFTIDEKVVNCDESRTGNLRILRMEECTMDEGAMKAIVEFLKASPFLEQFSFLKSEAPLSAGRLIAETLVGHNRLESLDLSGLDVGDDGIQAIGELVKGSTAMKTLTLSELPQLMDASILADALVSNMKLIQLDLSSNRLRRFHTLGQALVKNQTLQQLTLSRCSLEEGDECTDHTDVSTLSFYTHLGGFRGLQSLDLSYMHLSLRDLSDLAESLRENTVLERLLLNDLDRSFEPVQLDAILLALRDNTHLRIFELGRNSVRHEEVQSLKASLSVNKSLESLTLSGCGLTDATIIDFAQFIPKCSLQDLDISFNDFGKGGATAILDSLYTNTNLRSVSLYNSCWTVGGPIHFDCDGFEDINRAIQECLIQRND